MERSSREINKQNNKAKKKQKTTQTEKAPQDQSKGETVKRAPALIPCQQIRPGSQYIFNSMWSMNHNSGNSGYPGISFFLSSCRARSRLWRSSKRLWFKKKKKKPYWPQVTALQSKQKTKNNKTHPKPTQTKPTPRMHPGDFFLAGAVRAPRLWRSRKRLWFSVEQNCKAVKEKEIQSNVANRALPK